MEQLSEELLTAWLRLSGAINNQRLVTGMPFNEALVCGLLLRAQREGKTINPRDLCQQTGILKSQMNAILLSLEQRGALARRQSSRDRRQVELTLLPEGAALYEASHSRVMALVDSLVAAMGADAVRQLIPLLHQVVDTFHSIKTEV